jgi:ubiquinone/menaquinone biosynthesis C-methylase UbiE
LRGIIHLLRVWKEIRDANPKANLHLFYGWDTYDKMVKEGACDGKEKEEIVKLCNQEGITDHGRVGHKQLAEEYAKSGIWVYPSHFPEISCIAAMKAQVAGCIPVTTDYAALKETVKAGIVIPGNAEDSNVFFEWKMSLLDLMASPEAQEEVRKEVLKHREEFHWKDVAKKWSEDLFASVEPREFIKDRLEWVKSKCVAGEKIVDIGGNKGHTFNGWNRDDVTTVDIDKYDIPNFVQADATALPFSDKTFNVACLNEVLEHMPDPVGALKEAKRVAKDRIVITVPNEYEWLQGQEPFTTLEMRCKKEGKTREELAREGNIAVAFDTKDNYEHLYHVRYYTKELLKQHLKEAGIENYEIKKMNQGIWSYYGVVAKL